MCAARWDCPKCAWFRQAIRRTARVRRRRRPSAWRCCRLAVAGVSRPGRGRTRIAPRREELTPCRRWRNCAAEFPDRPLLAAAGCGCLPWPPTWHRWRDIFDLAHVVVVERPGVRLEADLPADLRPIWRKRLTGDPESLRSQPAGAIFVQTIAPHAVSATAIRERLSQGAPRATINTISGTVCSRPPFWPILTSTTFTASDRMRLNKLQQTAVSALEDIKARDIVVLDVRKLTSFYDSMIIASAESNRQVKALAHHVRDKLKAAGATIIGVEGEESGEWVLVDCGDIVVHVMQPAVRAYYNLEELWQVGASKHRAKAA